MYDALIDFCEVVASLKEDIIEKADFRVIEKDVQERNLNMISVFPSALEEYIPDVERRIDYGSHILNRIAVGDTRYRCLKNLIEKVLCGDHDLLYSAGAMSLLCSTLYLDNMGHKIEKIADRLIAA